MNVQTPTGKGLANNSVNSSRRSGPEAAGSGERATERVTSPDQQVPLRKPPQEPRRGG